MADYNTRMYNPMGALLEGLATGLKQLLLYRMERDMEEARAADAAANQRQLLEQRQDFERAEGQKDRTHREELARSDREARAIEAQNERSFQFDQGVMERLWRSGEGGLDRSLRRELANLDATTAKDVARINETGGSSGPTPGGKGLGGMLSQKQIGDLAEIALKDFIEGMGTAAFYEAKAAEGERDPQTGEPLDPAALAAEEQAMIFRDHARGMAALFRYYTTGTPAESTGVEVMSKYMLGRGYGQEDINEMLGFGSAAPDTMAPQIEQQPAEPQGFFDQLKQGLRDRAHDRSLIQMPGEAAWDFYKQMQRRTREQEQQSLKP